MMPRLLVLLALAATAASCRSGTQGGTAEPAGAEATQRTTLEVVNQAFLDMTIYVLRDGQQVRLGTAPGNSTTVFEIPRNLIFGATPLRFRADPIGAPRAPVTSEITVRPGEQVTMTIPAG